MGILTGSMASTLQTMASTQVVGSSTLPREVVRLVARLTTSQVGDSIKPVHLQPSILEVISSILVVKQVEGEDGQHSKVVVVGPILDKDMLLH